MTMNEEDDDEVPLAISLDAVTGPQSSRPQNSPVHLDTMQSVPVTLITGFLGAGKTTLVHNVLNAKHKHRIAVIVNDFGDTSGIESAMVKTAQDDVVVPAEEWVELANGCLCCSVKSDFVAALEGLMLKRDKFDYILIETTGLADPGPVAEALWTDDELEAAVHLDAIITVVDAKHIQQQLQQHSSDGAANEAQKQIAYADSVLLNKIDLLPSEQAVLAVESAIRTHNAEVDIMRTTHCSLEISQILNKGAFAGSKQKPSQLQQLHSPTVATEPQSQHAASQADHPEAQSHAAAQHDNKSTGQAGEDAQSTSRQPLQEEHGHQHSTHPKHEHPKHEHPHSHAGHLDSVRSISLVHKGQVDLSRIRTWLDSILWEKASHKQDIYRMKGLLNVVGKNEAHILQAVHELYDIVPGMCWSDLPASQRDQTKVVVIGRNLEDSSLHQGFLACFLS